MRVNASPADAIATPPPVRAADARATTVRSFAGVHAAALAASPAKGAREPAAAVRPDAAASSSTATGSRTSKGETYGPVDGQRYEEILSGPRNGMFINRSGNSRDGEAFVLVKRGEREFHIYGSGADRQVVSLGGKAGSDAPTPAATDGADVPGTDRDAKSGAPVATPEKTRTSRYVDVPGRAFDEIVSGPRNGMFVNRSGNARDGEAFVLVERARHEVHIYGSGKNRLVVRVIPPDLREDRDKVTAAERPAASAPTPNAGSAPASGVVLS